MADEKKTPPTASKSSTSRKKTTRTGRTKTVSKAKATPEQRSKRAQSAVSKAHSKTSASAKKRASEEKGLIDLFEHALRDVYYAEKKIYKALPKMIKAADDEALIDALTSHREETQSHIETLEKVFETMDMRAKGVKCEAIDGILEEAEGILDDFGGTLAGDAAIIFCARAVEHYEISRYNSMIGFADALGLDDAHKHLQSILDQETQAESKLQSLAEDSINEAASEYDDEDDHENEEDSSSSENGSKKDNSSNKSKK